MKHAALDSTQRTGDAHHAGNRASATRVLVFLHYQRQQPVGRLFGNRRREEHPRVPVARRLDDLAVLLEWAQAGEDVVTDLEKALDGLEAEIEAGEVKTIAAQSASFVHTAQNAGP